MKIRVPATSANLGPGFDSCGIALSKYLYLEVGKSSDEWYIQHDLGSSIPHDKTNLILETALKIAPQLAPHELKMTTEIPAARGLGSSSTAIVAGIELANRLATLNLSEHEKINLATEIEGHPDNVAPAICGNFVVASYDGENVYYVKHHFPNCGIVVYIPDSVLLTSESRGVLPQTLDYKEAVKASGIANVMIASVLNSDLRLAGEMMEQDLWHEKYRAPLVPHLKEIKEISKKHGGYGCVLSGAGPTVLLLLPEEVVDEVKQDLEKLPYEATIESLHVDPEGTQYF